MGDTFVASVFTLVKYAQTYDVVPALPVNVYVTFPRDALRYWLSRILPSCSNSTFSIPSISAGMVNSTTLDTSVSPPLRVPLTVKLIFVPPGTSEVGSMLCSTTCPCSAKL